MRIGVFSLSAKYPSSCILALPVNSTMPRLIDAETPPSRRLAQAAKVTETVISRELYRTGSLRADCERLSQPSEPMTSPLRGSPQPGCLGQFPRDPWLSGPVSRQGWPEGLNPCNKGKKLRQVVMIGPTGVGKTEIARRLAKLAGSPFFKVEATKFTEVGYVGRDVESMGRAGATRAGAGGVDGFLTATGDGAALATTGRVFSGSGAAAWVATGCVEGSGSTGGKVRLTSRQVLAGPPRWVRRTVSRPSRG